MQSQALILRTGAIKENDRLLTALTGEYGVISAFANGAKKPKSPLHGATQCYAYGPFEFSRRRDTYVVADARAEGVFFAGLAADISRLALAGYFSALFAELSPREEPAPEHLRLAMNALHFLGAGTRPQWLLKAVVEMRLICLAGYQPDLSGDGLYLDCARGVLAPEAGPGRVLLEPPVREAMRFVCAAPLERAFRFTLPEEGLRALSFASQVYLRHQTGRRFEELGYWEGLGA
jgi:DNA repair protein RecO (recombination protein O)